MKSTFHTDPDKTQYLKFYCPGCDQLELIPIHRGSNYKGPIWEFSGTPDNPTLNPSVRHFFPAHDNIPEETTCHYILTNGTLQYCTDSKRHNLGGQHIPLPDIPDKYKLE